tara:strand:+ start:21 stop:275 length:255 start_codon:yes stop_codon:yes gene_type:complete
MELVLSLGIIAVFRRLSNVSHLMASLLKRDFDISKHFFIIAKKNSIIDTPLRVVQNNNSLEYIHKNNVGMPHECASNTLLFHGE